LVLNELKAKKVRKNKEQERNAKIIETKIAKT
jgi:hypothetical protein